MTLVLLEAAVRSSALMLVVWMLLRATRVRDPGIERAAWVGALLASMVMPFAINSDILRVATIPVVGPVPSIDMGNFVAAEGSFDWRTLMLSIYASIAVALVARQCIGLSQLWRLRRTAIRMHDARFPSLDLRISSRVAAPANVFSTVLVPDDFATWTRSAQAAVVAHEQSHVLNNDFYVHCLAQLNRAVFWFNPLAWWLPRHLSLLCEHISDDAAIEVMKERTAYAELLVTVARKSVGERLAIGMAGHATLTHRIERILDKETPMTQTSRWTKVSMTFSLLPLAAIAAAIQTEQPSQKVSATMESQSPATQLSATTPVASGKVVLPKSNRAQPLSQPVYPPVSRRLRETGTVVLKLHVLEDGSVGDARVEKSSGYPDLDYSAMYESFRWKLDPGTVDGQPQRMWGQFAVTFKLKQQELVEAQTARPKA